MPLSMTLAPDGSTVPVYPGQTLLDAAVVAGIRLRAVCRNGACRECRALLLQGEVRYRVEWPGLLAEEKADGWVLPCVAEPTTDVVLQPR